MDLGLVHNKQYLYGCLQTLIIDSVKDASDDVETLLTATVFGRRTYED